jgi:hypothetical protein
MPLAAMPKNKNTKKERKKRMVCSKTVGRVLQTAAKVFFFWL